MHLRFLLTLLSFLFLNTEGNPPGDDGNDPPENQNDNTDPPDDVTFDDKQQSKVNDLLAAERKSTEERVAARIKADAEADRKKADEEAQRKRDEEAGEYDKVKTSLQNDLDTVSGERDTLKSENEALTAYFTAQYDAAMEDLPDVIKEFAPEDDASFEAKSRWLTKAQDQAKKVDTSPPRGNGPDRNPGGVGNTEDDKQAQSRMAAMIHRRM